MTFNEEIKRTTYENGADIHFVVNGLGVHHLGIKDAEHALFKPRHGLQDYLASYIFGNE